MTKSLLPSGCYDILPPFARQQSELSHKLLSVFESFGYEQISPPMLEYSDNLLSGRGSELSSQIFRIMDHSAHKVMGIRADITLQIARIASTRLSHAPRPLRLCYNGLILRMKGEQLKNDRQLRQTGIELIGVSSPEADAEVIIVAARALSETGISDLAIDINLPKIVDLLLVEEKFDKEELLALRNAVSHKDISAISNFSFRYRETLIALLQNIGEAEKVLSAIEELELPESVKHELSSLRQVVSILRMHGSNNWTITIDVTENRIASYHCGISFSIFIAGIACEVGRGGRYKIRGETANTDDEATGFTLYVETLLDILPKTTDRKRILVSDGVSNSEVENLHKDDFVTIYALSEYGNDETEAKRLGCGWIYKDGAIIKLEKY